MNASRPLTREDIVALVVGEEYHQHGVTTVCVLTTKSGFTVTADAIWCSDAEPDEQRARELALDRAINQIGRLEHYAQGRAFQQTILPTAAVAAMATLERMGYEHRGGVLWAPKLGVKSGRLEADLAAAFKAEEQAEQLRVGDIVKARGLDGEKVVMSVYPGDPDEHIQIANESDPKVYLWNVRASECTLVRRPPPVECGPLTDESGQVAAPAIDTSKADVNGYVVIDLGARPARLVPRSVESIWKAINPAVVAPDVDVPSPAELNGESLALYQDAMDRFLAGKSWQ